MKLDMKEEGVGGFIKRHWCFFSRSEQLTRATMITLVWDGA
jgi:hypothetical protein